MPTSNYKFNKNYKVRAQYYLNSTQKQHSLMTVDLTKKRGGVTNQI